MNAKQFFFTVKRMREAQKNYFKTKSPYFLETSKQLEKIIDDEIERVLKPEQNDLFK